MLSDVSALIDGAKWRISQRRNLHTLCRVYPSGFRVASTNFDPLHAWGSGAHMAAMNMQTNYLPVQLMFALFETSCGVGYVLKPPEMRGPSPAWPPVRSSVQRVSLRLLSLHNLPKQREQRPHLEGARGACHSAVPQLSGNMTTLPSLPDDGIEASPCVVIDVHTLGGMACVSGIKAPSQLRSKWKSKRLAGNGLNARFDETAHVIAAEPRETLVRIGVVDDDGYTQREVAYEAASLGALRPGYRCVHLRSSLGTRIERCYLFVHVSIESDANLWLPAKELQQQLRRQHERLRQLEAELSRHRAATHVVDAPVAGSTPTVAAASVDSVAGAIEAAISVGDTGEGTEEGEAPARTATAAATMRRVRAATRMERRMRTTRSGPTADTTAPEEGLRL